MFTRTSTTRGHGDPASALPSTCIPPWAGGEPKRAFPPLGVGRASHTPEDPAHTRVLAPFNASKVRATRNEHCLWHGHFHQLRLGERPAQKSGVQRDLGHTGANRSCLEPTGGRHLVHVHGKVLGASRLGRGCSRNLAVYFTSRSSSPAPAILCPREEWCNFSARATATVIRSCRNNERSRRCRRRCAAPETGCSLRSIPHR